MIKIKNESDNYTDFSMLEEGDVFYWSKYNGYFMKIQNVQATNMKTITISTNITNTRYNAVDLSDGHLYLVNDYDDIVKAHSASLAVEM